MSVKRSEVKLVCQEATARGGGGGAGQPVWWLRPPVAKIPEPGSGTYGSNQRSLLTVDQDGGRAGTFVGRKKCE